MVLVDKPDAAGVPAGSEPYEPRNLLDRWSRKATLEFQYRHMLDRERQLVARRLPFSAGDVLSVGSGWHPGRHLFPAPVFRMTVVDANPECVTSALASGAADEGVVGYAGRLDLPSESFDAVLYRLILHHVAFKEPLGPCFAEAARLLRPGGVMVIVEPGLWHPVGLALAGANRAGVSVAVHGTPDDIPLSPRVLVREARTAGLAPELHAVTYTWRRLPTVLQRLLQPLDSLGSRPRAAPFGHTLLVLARKPATETKQPHDRSPSGS